MIETEKIKLINDDGKRIDGRLFNELRQIKMEVGVLEKSDGSAYIEQGKTKIFAAVFGPKELHPKHLALPDRAVINCRYHMTSFSVEERKQLGMSRREIELSKVIRHALETVVFLEKFPRAGIDVFIEVIQADGGTRVAGLNAASLALADAGIYMRDLVVGCAAGKVDGKIVLDLCDIEDKYGEADMPIAFSPRLNSILLLQLNGKLSIEEFNEAIKLAKEGCMKIYDLMKETLKKKYSSAIVEEE